MLWAINGPRIADGAPMVFRDEPGPGQEIVCESPLMQWGTANPGGVKTEGSFAPDQWTVQECSASLLVVELRPVSDDVGRIPVLLGRSKVTDRNRSEYRNSGSVTIGGGTIPVSTVVAWAGGEGAGERPGASATTTVPGTPTETVPGTQSTFSTPPVTVTVPGETVSVIAPPTSIGSATTPDQTSTTLLETGTSTTSTTSTTTSGATPTSTTTSGAAPATAPAATPTRRPVSGGAPVAIDTGVAPASTVDARLVGAGLSVLLATGLALLYTSRRNHE